MDNSNMIYDEAEPPQPAHESSLQILIANEQSLLTVRTEQLHTTVRQILVDAGYRTAMISIAVVDDPTIQDLNRLHLQHDWPTDVLSFPIEDEDGHLEGEVIVSADTAERCADEFCWPATEELLLYAIHGTLHLVGYHDKQPNEITAMRSAEMKYLRQACVNVSAKDQRWRDIDCEFSVPLSPSPRLQPPTSQS